MPDAGDGEDGVYAKFFPYLDSYVQFVVNDGHVTEVSFPERPNDAADDDHPLLERVESYLGGTVKDDFDDVPVELAVRAEIKSVLQAVREIPYGKAMSVTELLREFTELDPEDENNLDLVREALDANPTPLIIPDHRVRAAPSGAPPPIEQRLRSLERIVT